MFWQNSLMKPSSWIFLCWKILITDSIFLIILFRISLHDSMLVDCMFLVIHLFLLVSLFVGIYYSQQFSTILSVPVLSVVMSISDFVSSPFFFVQLKFLWSSSCLSSLCFSCSDVCYFLPFAKFELSSSFSSSFRYKIRLFICTLSFFYVAIYQ